MMSICRCEGVENDKAANASCQQFNSRLLIVLSHYDDMSSDLSSDMCPSVKALGHMCGDKVCGIVYI